MSYNNHKYLGMKKEGKKMKKICILLVSFITLNAWGKDILLLIKY